MSHNKFLHYAMVFLGTIFVLALFFLLPVYQADHQPYHGDKDGKWWNRIDAREKNLWIDAYLSGAVEGVLLGEVVSHRNIKRRYGDEAEKEMIHVTKKDIRTIFGTNTVRLSNNLLETMDNVYSEEVHQSLDAADIAEIILLSNLEDSDDARKLYVYRELEKLRKSSN